MPQAQALVRVYSLSPRGREPTPTAVTAKTGCHGLAAARHQHHEAIPVLVQRGGRE